MKCPFCDSELDSRLVLTRCTHCGSPIFNKLEVCSQTHLIAQPEINATQMVGFHNETTRVQDELEGLLRHSEPPSARKTTAEQRKINRFQFVFESIGMAGLYALIFTLISTPVIYFFVQPQLLRSFSVESLITGSFLFYFVFGLVVFYITSRSIQDE